MNPLSRFSPAILLAALAVCPALRADVKLPPVFSDHMVLQRDMAVPVWGMAAPEEEVTVSIAGQTKTTKADAKGLWRVKLDPLKVGPALTLTVKGKNTLTLKDVLVGEVWVGSGQSNMAGTAGGYAKSDENLAKILAGGPLPKIRHLHSRGAGWQEATPQTMANFGAILLPFGLRLQQELDVPVGLLLGAVGGTPSGYWLTEEMFQTDAACKSVVQKFAATYQIEPLQKRYEADLAAWEKASAAAKAEKKNPPRRPNPPGKPGEATGGKIGNLFEAHIRGFVGYGIRGVLWDQGESGTAIVGVDQFTLMGALIRGWRQAWGQGEFPFLYVQKPSGGGPAWDPEHAVTKQANKFAPLPAQVPADGHYRETHIHIRTYPQTAMVTSTDLGSGVHPTNKSGYGERAARVALAVAYGKKVEFYGPLYESHTVEGGKVRVRFTHVGQGLAFKHGEKLQGFAIAGEDKKFHWATAVIAGDTVVLTSEQVAKPVAVRYAWASVHPWANLFNQDGLPAQSFRTDDWK
ncbi:MAG: hypothetical protein RLZZ265_367 [Verrucomicrobiota bacterium]|jgi:sialate O-acetylesterase